MLDSEIDYENYKSTNHSVNSRRILTSNINNRNLTDPFRYLNGVCREYTWKRLTPLQKGRLDFFLITENLLLLLRNCEIDISYKSDHSIILLELQFTVHTHGKGFWKFNNSLLEDIEYVNLITLKINDVIQQYCLPLYNIKNVLNIDRSEVQFVINDQFFLETLLMEIRGETISFSSHKIKTQNMRELFLQNKISEIELNLNDSNKDELVNLQKELENIRNEKMNEYFIRSRANWIDNGEKITKYFCNLEKQHIAFHRKKRRLSNI